MSASPAEVPPEPEPPAAGREDGRTKRSRTTRRVVAEAYLDLLDSGDLRPTARAIGARAGVSERAVFRHFQDLETLMAEAAQIQIQRVGQDIPLPPAEPGAGHLADRLAALALRWCTLNERVTPVRRAALLQEPFSKEIARRLSWVRGLARHEAEAAAGPELAALAAPDRRRATAALAVAISWETWNELRRRQDLDAREATEVVAGMLAAAVPAAPPA